MNAQAQTISREPIAPDSTVRKEAFSKSLPSLRPICALSWRPPATVTPGYQIIWRGNAREFGVSSGRRGKPG